MKKKRASERDRSAMIKRLHTDRERECVIPVFVGVYRFDKLNNFNRNFL